MDISVNCENCYRNSHYQVTILPFVLTETSHNIIDLGTICVEADDVAALPSML